MSIFEISSLLSAALEAFVHQLLYMTNVYPSDTFTKTAFLGIVGYTNRHAGVVQYVSECIQMAVPVLIKGGQMIVSIGNSEERFLISVTGASSLSLQILESRLRDLILSVHAQERRKEKRESFQIQLRPVAEECPELVRGMSQGQWYQVQSDLSEKRKIRPIHDLNSEEFRISFFEEKD